jgi:hypothetical protein
MAAGKKYKQKDQNTGGKIKRAGIDSAGVSDHDTDSENAFKDGARIFFAIVMGQDPPKDDSTYADPAAVKTEGKTIKDVRKKFAPNADKPTTAAGKKGKKDIPQVVQEVDPEKRAQVYPQLYQQMMQMTSILSMGSGMGGGGGGGAGSGFPTIMPAGVSFVLQDSFTGALAILTRKYGFELVIEVFLAALAFDQIKFIDAMYVPIVKNGVSNLIKLALYFGPLDIPVSYYDNTIYGDIVPDNVVEQKDVPDYYVKQYYSLGNEPYPGYDQWLSTDGITSVYVKRPAESYVFSSANEEIFSTAERELAADLDKYFYPIDQGNGYFYAYVLTGAQLNIILNQQATNIENNTINLNMGSNASGSGGGGGGGGGMGGMLGGQLQSLIGMLQQQTSKESPLTAVNNVMQQFQKDMGFNNQLFELGKSALGGGNPLGSLGNLGGLSNIMSGFTGGNLGGLLGGITGGNLGGIEGVLGNLTGGSGLLGSFGGFGGFSGGGGGGAGSGFPTAGFDNYYGGQVSDNGIKNIEQMLKLLGIE